MVTELLGTRHVLGTGDPEVSIADKDVPPGGSSHANGLNQLKQRNAQKRTFAHQMVGSALQKSKADKGDREQERAGRSSGGGQRRPH